MSKVIVSGKELTEKFHKTMEMYITAQTITVHCSKYITMKLITIQLITVESITAKCIREQFVH